MKSLRKEEMKKELKVKDDDHNRKYGSIKVSEHSIIRFIERIYGIDIDGVVQKMIPENVTDMMQKCSFADGKYCSGDCKVVLRNKIVVTITPRDKK